MLKKHWGLLIVVLLLGLTCAHAETNEDILASLKECLVNSFGYSSEEAEGFEIVDKKKLSINEKAKILEAEYGANMQWEISNFIGSAFEENIYLPETEEVTEHLKQLFERDEWIISIAHPDHSEWAYHYYDYDEELVSPFGFTAYTLDYPLIDEGVLRNALREARENGWFVNWTEESRAALVEYVNNHFHNVRPPMLWEGISAGNAIHELFAAVSETPLELAGLLREWRDAELGFYGLEVQENYVFASGHSSYYVSDWPDNNGPSDVQITRFVGEAPEKIKQYLNHPQLEGWKTVCGGVLEGRSAWKTMGYAMVAYEKEGERMLAEVHYDPNGTSDLVSLSRTALYSDRPMYILPTLSLRWHAWDWDDQVVWMIGYQNSPTEYEKFCVNSFFGRECIAEYKRFDTSTGSGAYIRPTWQWDINATIQIYENNHVIMEENVIQNMPSNIWMIDISDFTDIQLWLTSYWGGVPKGYVLLRQQKDYPNGTLARIIEYPIEEEWTVQVGNEQFRITEDDFDSWGADMIQKESYVILRGQQNYPDGTRAKIIEFPDREKTQWTVGVGNECFKTDEYGIALDYSISAYPDMGNQLYNESIGYLKVLNNMELKEERSVSSETLMELPANTVMFDLRGYENTGETWLQVAVPQERGEIGWRMQPSDVVGYINVDVEYDEGTKQHSYEGVLFGDTPLALEWRE